MLTKAVDDHHRFERTDGNCLVGSTTPLPRKRAERQPPLRVRNRRGCCFWLDSYDTDGTMILMTLPYEQYIAITNTRNFLLSLMDAQKTPKTPKYLREEARRLLKHFPNEYEANDMVKAHTESTSNAAIMGRGYDPIEYSPRRGGWIFWDETWTQPSKPYLCRRDAQDALNSYLKTLE